MEVALELSRARWAGRGIAAATIAFAAVVWLAWRVLTPPLTERFTAVEITLICQAAFLALALLAVLLLRRRVSVPLRWPPPRTLLVCVALGGVSWAIGLAVDRAVALAPGSDAWMGYGTIHWIQGVDFTAVAIALVFAPLAEELFFRGVVLSGTRAGGSRMLAVLLSAAAFALFHPPAHAATRAFVRGLLLGTVVDRTGTVVCAIVIHATSNAISLVYS